jgi:hypothetical protein
VARARPPAILRDRDRRQTRSARFWSPSAPPPCALGPARRSASHRANSTAKRP